MKYPEYEHIEILSDDVHLIGKATFEVVENSIELSDFKITFNGNNVTKLMLEINDADYYKIILEELTSQALGDL